MATLTRLSLRTVIFGIGYFFHSPRKFLQRLQLKLRQLRDPDYPALAPQAVNFIAHVLSENRAALVGEWGSGRSTLWFSSRAARVVSVEHNPEWRAVIGAEIARRGAGHVTLTGADDGPEYAPALLTAGIDKFDLLLIDGRQREDCAAVAPSVVKPGGYIVVDNANRPEYAQFLAKLGTPIGTFTGHCTTTMIFRA
jgi:predicted O-methyltransferase YrrM